MQSVAMYMWASDNDKNINNRFTVFTVVIMAECKLCIFHYSQL